MKHVYSFFLFLHNNNKEWISSKSEKLVGMKKNPQRLFDEGAADLVTYAAARQVFPGLKGKLKKNENAFLKNKRRDGIFHQMSDDDDVSSGSC